MHPLIRSRVAVKIVAKSILGGAGACVPGRRKAGELCVLYYHRVNDYPSDTLDLVSQEITVSPRSFARQLDYLARHDYRVLSADEVERCLATGDEFPGKAVLLTFDDGYADNHEFAFPLLQERGFSALFFIVTDFIDSGAEFPWDRGGAPGYSEPMSWADVRQMSAGGMGFGSHTMSHPRLDRLEPPELELELTESKATIEGQIDRRVDFLAYPRNDFSPEVVEASCEAGYRGAFTTIPGGNPPDGDAFRLRRLEVSASDTLTIFALKLRGALDYMWIKETVVPRQIRAWITAKLTS